ncbi:MAG: tRNA (adenosine(37)-N6)-dimethylallyltransferase MiaA [Ruminococcaceae bacterium]|nr:tRNA (adenosine(37)-N6)-dimethylallyltransferase MiaA [Oscillospiraceae bacterium]
MTSHKKIKILAIVGPTASGKTAVSIEVARRLGGEIVSCDSMQVYRRMNIGTAKPTVEEMSGVPHHMIDAVEPDVAFSCADYVTMAGEAVREIVARQKLPILCGGTGLYLDRFLCGEMEETHADEDLRASLFAFAEREGALALHERLRAVDPESADAIHPNNVKRVVRALEIYEQTGIPKSEFDRRSQAVESPFEAVVVGLFYPRREVLYERINRRVDMMMADGLLEETRGLLEDGVFEVNLTAAQAIGYKELLGYLGGNETLTEATENLKTATRRYAKRQLTWFSAKPYVRWVDMEREGELRSLDAVCDEIVSLFRGEEGAP